jgi:type IX secretion system PorP/SprF family membrane protein
MKRIWFVIFVLFSKCILAQDVEFSQYYANPLYLNPAFAGLDDYTRISLNYKSVLPSSYGGYSTYSASVDKYFDAIGGGLGFQVMNDRQGQGIINNLGFNLIYAFHTSIKHNWSFSMGLKVGYNINTLNAQNLVMPDMLDPSTGVSSASSESGLYQKSQYLDFSAGMISWYDNYYLGFSIDHLSKPISTLGSESPGPIEQKYTVHGGIEIPFYNTIYKVDMIVSPNFIYQQQGSSSKINLGVYLSKSAFTSGLWLKTNTQFNFTGAVVMLGYVTELSVFAYSYDVPFYKGGLDGILKGSHEVTFVYKFKYKRKRKKIKAIKCPKF